MLLAKHLSCALTRIMLCLSVVLASLIPSFAMASGAQPVSVSRYVCGPSVHIDLTEVESALRELLIASGKIKDDEQDGAPAAPCEHCVFSAMTQPALLPQEAPAIVFTRAETLYLNKVSLLAYSAQGPPLGGRAPPHFS